MKIAFRYVMVLTLLVLFGYGLYLLGQNTAVRTVIFPQGTALAGERSLAFGRAPRGDSPFAGRRGGFGGDFDRFERGSFARDGGFSLFGLLRLGGSLLQVAVIVAVVVLLERTLSGIRRVRRTA